MNSNTNNAANAATQGCVKVRISCWRRLFAVAVVALLALTARADRPLIPFVNINGNSYSNVVVREVTETTITLAHSKGMTAINQAKLSRKELEDLLLIEKAPPTPPKPKRTFLPAPAEGEAPAGPREAPSVAQVMAMGEQFKSLDSPAVQQIFDSIGSVPARAFLWALAAYLFMCLCFLLICSKAGQPSPILVWLPVLQMFPLYRAAKMSPAWFGLMLFTLVLHLALIAMMSLQMVTVHVVLGFAALFVLLSIVHAIGSIIWCFKICTARGKPAALGVLLLLPGLNILTLLYLAFSAGDAPKMDRIKFQPVGPKREVAMAD